MEKQKPDKKFKQNSYEEIRKLIEDGDDNNIVKWLRIRIIRKIQKKIYISLNYLIIYSLLLKFNQIFSKTNFFKMETFSPDDVLVDNLSFKLNKGSSYVNDRRSVRFFRLGLIFI